MVLGQVENSIQESVFVEIWFSALEQEQITVGAIVKRVLRKLDDIVLDSNGLQREEIGRLYLGLSLKELREETGKNIFVINGSGYDFNIEVVEGIRYMDINGLWYNYNNKDIDLTDAFKLLKFRINIVTIYSKF